MVMEAEKSTSFNVEGILGGELRRLLSYDDDFHLWAGDQIDDRTELFLEFREDA